MLICWAKKAAVHVERSDASVGVLFFVGFKCSPSLFPIYFRTVKNGLVLHSPLYLHLYVSVSRSLCVRKTPQSCCLLSPSFLLSLFACDGGCFPVVGGHGDGSAGRPLDQDPKSAVGIGDVAEALLLTRQGSAVWELKIAYLTGQH